MSGRFIAVEGADGCGKSTQAPLLAERMGALLTREPGGTPVGERIRALWLDPATQDLDDRAEALLIAAARAHHVASVVRPALEAGRDVVSDRYVASSLAYQGHGRQLDVDRVAEVNDWATGGLRPDVVVLIEIDRAEASRRVGHAPDRVEALGEDFHQRVADAFRAMADADPTWVVVDGSGSVDTVADRVHEAVAVMLSTR